MILPRCLGGVTPGEVHRGEAIERKAGNRAYLEQEIAREVGDNSWRPGDFRKRCFYILHPCSFDDAPLIRRLKLQGARQGGSVDNIKESYPVDTPGVESSGVWKLKVQDLAAISTGYINSWSLQFIN